LTPKKHNPFTFFSEYQEPHAMSAPQDNVEWQPIRANRCKLTLRERWVRAMHFEPPGRLPHMEFGYWTETLPAWHAQGLPRSVDDEKKAYAYFGIEDWARAPISVGLCPAFEKEVIEESDEYVIWRDHERAVRKELKHGIRSIPHYLEFGIKSREDWRLFKERLDPTTPGRYPEDWDDEVARYRGRDFALCVNIGSMIGVPRDWIGFENIAMLAYDDPALLEEIIETLCVCVCETLKPALEQVDFDFGAGWEDICFKNGPVLSPKMFDQWIVPRYKRITDLLAAHGVDVVWTDCDGNINPILDQFLAGGINCMFPIEAAAGSDPVAMREKYGKRILLHGGFDKMALLKGPKAIEAELLRLKPVVDEGAFIPHVDHRCPADVTLENYKVYLKLKREILNAGDLVPHYEA
jgi:uroporphyrinogen decarboxylase